jgi:hypothetical protein
MNLGTGAHETIPEQAGFMSSSLASSSKQPGVGGFSWSFSFMSGTWLKLVTDIVTS